MPKDFIKNNHYYQSILRRFNIKRHKYYYTILIITIYFITTGYKIVHDVVINDFDSKYALLRNLFLYNYFASLFYVLITIFISDFFTDKINVWYNNDFNYNGYEYNKLNKSLKNYSSPYIFIIISIISFIRYIITINYYPWPMGDNDYVIWYYGMDVLIVFSTLVLFYTILIYSYFLYRSTNDNFVSIIDTGDYEKKYKPVYDLSQKIIYVALGSISVEVSGLIYWIFEVRRNLVFLASFFYGIIILISFTSIFWIMYSGISNSLENSKRRKIEEIRKQDSGDDIKDIRISFHNEIGYWQVGPKILDSVVLPIFVAEMIALIQFVIYNFLTYFKKG
jgi:hypothetical protein